MLATAKPRVKKLTAVPPLPNILTICAMVAMIWTINVPVQAQFLS